jgi:predicted ATPase/class 3 adenylate cyclase
MTSTPALPKGTITFLLTDIQGSTRLWEQYPEAMRGALVRHDVLISDSVRRHGGVVIKSRGEGDSIFAVFARAADAVAAAGALQQALLAEPWPAETPLRVRVALHTGEAELREGDYFGPAVIRCARLRAAAHGGQVVLSQATCEQVGAALPPGVRFRELGVHRLKDLQLPVRIFQLEHPALPADFPPLRSLEAFAHNLPVQLTSFIGREAQIAEAKRLLETARLLTLVGAGGCGKTRLSLQIAADLVDDYADGVWLVELAPLSDPEGVPQVVATTLGVREEPGRSLMTALADYLRPRTLLLLLDNCEHLIQACARHAEALLRSCPNLVILATSREPLGIAGETPFRVPSLTLPNPEALSRLPADPLPLLTQYEAARLFVERAQTHQPGFAVTGRSAVSVARVCERLDGIPLAIELAAARVKVLPVEQIATRLDDRFRLLTGGSRTALPQHQTLRALIDWSYNLLSEPEQVLLRRLSVFAGGFNLEAAEAVCPGAASEAGASLGVEAWEVLELLSRLVDKSLVMVEAGGEGEGRYRLLETVRQYSQERLAEAGETEAVRERHALYFLALAERDYLEFSSATQAHVARRLSVEYDNLYAALSWTHTNGVPPALALRLTSALWWYWYLRGQLSEARRWLNQALARGGEPPAPPRDEGWPDFVTARAWARTLLGASGHAMFQSDFAAAVPSGEASVAILRELGETRELAMTLRGLGWAVLAQGDIDYARAVGEESISLFQELGDLAGLARSLNFVGHIAHDQGDDERASTLWHESVTLARQTGDQWMLGTGLANLAKLAETQGRWEAAGAFYQQSLPQRSAIGDRRGTAECLEGLAAVLAALSNPSLGESRPPISALQRAARLMGAARGIREAIGAPLMPHLDWHVDRGPQEAQLRAALGEAAFAAASAQGRAMTLEQSISEALKPPGS